MERERAIKLPIILNDDSFVQVVKKLSFSIVDAIAAPTSFESLRTTAAGHGIRELVDYLAANVDNPAIVHALL